MAPEHLPQRLTPTAIGGSVADGNAKTSCILTRNMHGL